MSGPLARLVTDEEGQVLLAEAADVPLNPASLTKLMVLYLVFRDLDMARMVAVPEAAVVRRRPGRVPQSNMGLKAGQRVSVSDLVLGMIVPSANDAAVTIAHLFGAETFVERLNAEATALGLGATRFASASGLGNGRTTARDMATLSRRLWQDFPAWRSLFSVGSFHFNGRSRRNTNDLLFSFPGMVGLKTGSTATLRRNLATVVERDGRTLFGIVLNAADKAERDRAMTDALATAASLTRGRGPAPVSVPQTRPASLLQEEQELAMGLQARALLGTVDDIAQFLGGKVFPKTGGPVMVSRIITSAQEVLPGDIYVPISAAREKRQALADRAVAKGAVAVMSSGGLVRGDYPVIDVPRLDHALAKLAEHARSAFMGRVIGVTGSVGKTTTKDMMALALSYCGATNHTTANLNSGNANLAAVASLPASAAYSVLELAMMDQGAVRRKAAVAKPHVAVITSIGLSHGAHHGEGGSESILIGKTGMFFELAPGGIAVLPSGDRSYDGLVARAQESGRVARIISCGERAADDVRLLDMKLHPTFSEASVLIADQRVDYLIGQPGAHFVMNSLLVAGALLAVGGNPQALLGLAGYVPTGRRIERFRAVLGKGRIVELIDDAYNAAPDSVRALLDLLKLRDRARRKVLILGDMLELGPEEIRHHLELVPFIEEAGIDLLVTVGPKAALVAGAVKGIQTVGYEDAKAAAKGILPLLQDRDLVAIKGSNGMNLMAVVMSILGSPAARVRQDYRWSIEKEPNTA